MNNTKILNCRCGGKAVLKKRRETFGHGEFPLVAWVECCSCGVRSRSFIVDGYYGETTTCDDAIDIWNTLNS